MVEHPTTLPPHNETAEQLADRATELRKRLERTSQQSQDAQKAARELLYVMDESSPNLLDATAEQLADWARELRERLERTRQQSREAQRAARELLEKRDQLEAAATRRTTLKPSGG